MVKVEGIFFPIAKLPCKVERERETFSIFVDHQQNGVRAHVTINQQIDFPCIAFFLHCSQTISTDGHTSSLLSSSSTYAFKKLSFNFCSRERLVLFLRLMLFPLMGYLVYPVVWLMKPLEPVFEVGVIATHYSHFLAVNRRLLLRPC